MFLVAILRTKKSIPASIAVTADPTNVISPVSLSAFGIFCNSCFVGATLSNKNIAATITGDLI